MNADAYAFYQSLGSPKYICAPMVDQSELAFRELSRNHGVQLAYTPMLHSKIMTTTKGYRHEFFTTNPQDRPLFVQLCGNDPQIVVKAGLMVQDECDAIDINCGCPQGIARKGNYGAYLLEKPEIIVSLVEALKQNLKIPVTVKMRILKDRKKTIQLAQSFETAGASIITVHGRTKEQNKETVGECDWTIIRDIKAVLKIPVFANGGIHSWVDVQRCLEFTGADAVMSSEALLENPALFSGIIKDLDDLAEEYMQIALKVDTKIGDIKGHLFKLLHSGLCIHTDLRTQLAKANTYHQHLEIVVEMKLRRKDVKVEDKLGWYHRYQKFNTKDKELKLQQVQDAIIDKQLQQLA